MAEPTKKDPAIKGFLSALAGASREETIRARRCMPAPIGCGGDAHAFKDSLSVKEYRISGLCQACQDKIWPPS